MSVSKINVVLLLYIAFYCFGRSQAQYCKSFPNGCCPFTKWDPKGGRCVECKAGYYWIDCNRTCPYPHYGRKCKQNCTCSEEVCNFITGCTEGK
ncbi:multiple epidermal growth factor-like domains protein 10 [Crassostrea virginica]